MTRIVKLTDGTIIEEDLYEIARQIQEKYGDWVKIQAINIHHRDFGPNSKPYRIIEIDKLGNENIIFDCDALDQRVLDKLHEIDTHRGIDALAQLELAEQARRKAEVDADMEYSREVAKPLIEAALKTDKTFTFKNEHGDLVKLDDHGAKVVKHGD